jgi:hypothetical protein
MNLNGEVEMRIFDPDALDKNHVRFYYSLKQRFQHKNGLRMRISNDGKNILLNDKEVFLKINLDHLMQNLKNRVARIADQFDDVETKLDIEAGSSLRSGVSSIFRKVQTKLKLENNDYDIVFSDLEDKGSST